MNPTIYKATIKNINFIYNIIDYYAKKGVILKRTKKDISSEINNFAVAFFDNEPIGVISYFNYGEDLKEIRSFAVLEEFKNRGVGSFLLKYLLKDIFSKITPKVFTLTYSPDFFIKNGFSIVSKDTLPQKIWKDCNKCKERDNCGETSLVFTSESNKNTS
jgi:amino-acid N-acetyltransferase